MEPLAAAIDAPLIDGGESTAPEPTCACLWCRVAFGPRGAMGKCFCSNRCRAAYHRGCRVWAMRAIEEGLLSLEAVRNASRSPYTESPGVSRPSGAER